MNLIARFDGHDRTSRYLSLANDDDRKSDPTWTNIFCDPDGGLRNSIRCLRKLSGRVAAGATLGAGRFCRGLLGRSDLDCDGLKHCDELEGASSGAGDWRIVS